MKKQGWKTLAIVFIVLFVLETALFVMLLAAGTASIEKESICAINICEDEKYTAYFYDDYENICYCYEGADITHQEYVLRE